jgi:hypothetical protein
MYLSAATRVAGGLLLTSRADRRLIAPSKSPSL